jgi:hypothetical protein
MKLHRALVGILTALMATVGFQVVAEPAFAAPWNCNILEYDNGRHVETTNANNGGGSAISGDVCWTPDGNGYYKVHVRWTVSDVKADGAGATIRIEYTGKDGATHYLVPASEDRAWTNGESAFGTWNLYGIKNVYVRACLTNTSSPAHHCGPKA